MSAFFRSDELIFVLPKGHRLARSKKPLFFVDTLDEELICLSAGAASLQKQRAAALAVNRPLKIRMQLRSFEAVCHMVAAGLGIALLPKGATQPLIKSLQLAWRPLGDAWGQRKSADRRRPERGRPGYSQLRQFPGRVGLVGGPGKVSLWLRPERA